MLSCKHLVCYKMYKIQTLTFIAKQTEQQVQGPLCLNPLIPSLNMQQCRGSGLDTHTSAIGIDMWRTHSFIVLQQKPEARQAPVVWECRSPSMTCVKGVKAVLARTMFSLHALATLWRLVSQGNSVITSSITTSSYLVNTFQKGTSTQKLALP